MIHIGLFEGIGGFSLAAQWAGWDTLATCEINPFGQNVLKHYWPKAYHHGDIKTLTYDAINTELSIRFGGGGETDLLLSRAGFHANPTPLPGNDLVKKMPVISGRKCLESFERFPRNGSWAKTFSDLLIGQEGWCSTRCKLTWKLRGTKFNRMYFQLVASTLHTDEKGFGLLPTPLAIDGSGNGRKLRLKKDCNRDPNQMGSWRGDLKDYAAMGMLPTPTTRDYKGARSKEALVAAGRNETNSLPDFFSQSGISSQLNPQFVEEMMGFPIGWTDLKHLETQ